MPKRDRRDLSTAILHTTVAPPWWPADGKCSNDTLCSIPTSSSVIRAALMHKINLLNTQRLSAADRAKIEAVGPTIELVDAGGWFDGEYRETWPAYTAARYLRPAGGSAPQCKRARSHDIHRRTSPRHRPIRSLGRPPRSWLDPRHS